MAGGGRGLLGETPGREQRHRPPGCALVLAFLPGNPGDVEVRPLEFFREPRKEAGRCDAAARAPGDVREVGEIAVEALLIVLPERQLPAAVIGVVACGD